jgi:hypothetical protein
LNPISPRSGNTAGILALVVALLWATAATAFELALDRLTPCQVLLWSVAVSLLVLALLLVPRPWPAEAAERVRHPGEIPIHWASCPKIGRSRKTWFPVSFIFSGLRR